MNDLFTLGRRGPIRRNGGSLILKHDTEDVNMILSLHMLSISVILGLAIGGLLQFHGDDFIDDIADEILVLYDIVLAHNDVLQLELLVPLLPLFIP